MQESKSNITNRINNRNDTNIVVPRYVSITGGKESDTNGCTEAIRIPTNIKKSEDASDLNNNPIKPIQPNNNRISVTVVAAGSSEKIAKFPIKTPHGVEIVGFNAAEIASSFEPYTRDVGEAPALNLKISKNLIARSRVYVDGIYGEGAFDLQQHTRDLSRAKRLQSEVRSLGAMRIIHSQTVGTRTQGSINATGTLPSRTDSRHTLELKSNGNTEEMNNTQSEHTKSSGSGTENINGIFWYDLTLGINISLFSMKNHVNLKQYCIDLNYLIQTIQLIYYQFV